MPKQIIKTLFMKRFFAFLLITLITLGTYSFGQDTTRQKTKPAPKEDGYEMKQYFFVMLIKGTTRSQDSATAIKIQKGHMDNINRLAKEGKIVVAGPFGDESNWKGIFIFDAGSKEEVEQYLKTDPAVSSGRLSYEIHPWWTAKNCVFK